MQFATHNREGQIQVEVVPTTLHFNAVQAQLEKSLSEKNSHASRDLDYLQELKGFINRLTNYKSQLLDKVTISKQENRDKKTQMEDEESIKEIDQMINEAKAIILDFGYEGVSLDILTYFPELLHKDYTVQSQKMISQEIIQRGKVGIRVTST